MYAIDVRIPAEAIDLFTWDGPALESLGYKSSPTYTSIDEHPGQKIEDKCTIDKPGSISIFGFSHSKSWL